MIRAAIFSFAVITSVASASSARAQAVDAPAGRQAQPDSAAVATVVAGFHDALARGDSASALALLAPDVRIVEGGGVETLQDYRTGHLSADIAYAAAVSAERGPLHVTVSGDAAWVVSTARSRGTFRGRPIDSQGAELTVLARTAQGWKIAAVHWSSRAAR